MTCRTLLLCQIGFVFLVSFIRIALNLPADSALVFTYDLGNLRMAFPVIQQYRNSVALLVGDMFHFTTSLDGQG